MIGQKLIKMLQTLDPASFRRLGLAFTSPYFTESPLLPKLYDLLKKEYPRFDSGKLDKEKIFRVIYSDKPYNDGALRVLVRDFAKITEDFVLFEALKNDETARLKALTKWYGRNNLYTEFERGTQNLLARIEDQPYRDVEYFRDVAELCTNYFFHLQTEKHTLDDEMLTRLSDSSDKAFLLFKLRLAGEMKNRERILAKQYKHQLPYEILSEEAANCLKNNIPYALYHKLLELYEEPANAETYIALKAQLIENFEHIRTFDRSLLLTQLINYAIQQMNGGEESYNKHVLDLYRLALDNGLALSNGKMEAGVYQNIVSTGCKAKEFEWTEQFSHFYAPYLKDDIRQDCTTMALGYLSFSKEDYDGAIELFNGHHFFNLLLEVKSRVILAKAWFEKFLQDPVLFEFLICRLDTNEKFIRRNRILSDYKKEEILRFFQAVRQLAFYIYEKKPAPFIRSRFAEQLCDGKRLPSKEWLTLKIDHYESA